MKPHLVATLLLTLLLATGTTFGQVDEEGLLTIDRLFASPEFAPDFVGPMNWDENGESYTRIESSESLEGGQDLVRYQVVSGERRVVVTGDKFVPVGAESPLRIEEYTWSPDGTQLLIYTNSARVWRLNTRGDYWVLDIKSGSLRQLAVHAPPSTTMFAKFSPSGDRVAYVVQNNIYVEDLESGGVTQLTADGGETVVNGTFDWVYEEELSLRDGFRWSPDGKSIAYWQLDMSGVGEFLLINNTDSIYSFVVPVQYPKVGTTNSAARVGIVTADGGQTRWIDVPGDPRNNYIARMDWAGNSDGVLIQRLNRLQNANELLLADAVTLELKTIIVERDSAWVDVRDDLQWLGGGRQFVWVSESDGWRKVYVLSRDGKKKTVVTHGNFDIESVERVDEAGGWVYYIASPDNPTQRYLYRSRLDGAGDPQRLSPKKQPGWHSYTIAPKARYAVHEYASFGAPEISEIVSLPDHRVISTLVDNDRLRKSVSELERGRFEFFRVPAEDGTQLDGWMMFPPDFDSTKAYPLFFYVYGEPWGQTVTDTWGGHLHLWHLMHTQKGYIVASIDNRGTPSLRGRDWRKSIYRGIGILASADQAAAARELAKRPYIDADRVGIWGWSGGGSMTLNMLLRHPELYHVGLSVAPVPDQLLYDTIYQERYMGLPWENEEGYRRGSPITFAENLQGDLLIVHGTGDDNVHYQGTERLINALIAANKQFTMMAYPNRSHGIFEGRNTTRHLFTLLTNYLYEHLPAGPR